MGLNAGHGRTARTHTRSQKTEKKQPVSPHLLIPKECPGSSTLDLLLCPKTFAVTADVGLTNGTQCGSWTNCRDTHTLPTEEAWPSPSAPLSTAFGGTPPLDLLLCPKVFSVTNDVGMPNGTQRGS